jgi:outer membrane protein assembly factor BamB
MLKNIFACLLVLCVFVPLAFGQEATVWEYDTDLSAEIGHFEITPLGSIFVGRPDRAVALDQYTGEVIWERLDIRGCRQHVDDPDTENVNEADGTIRCRVYGMEGPRDRYLYLPRFSTIPNTNFGLFEVGFQECCASIRYAVFDLATGSTLWDSSEARLSFERTHGFRYVPQLNQFLLSGESADGREFVAALSGSDGELLWQQEIDFLDRFKFVGTPNNAQVLIYGKTDGGQRTLVSMGLTDGVEQWRVEGFLRNDARNRNVLLEADSDGTVVLYLTKDGPFRLRLDSGEIVWRAGDWDEDPPDRGAARMVLDGELLFVPNGRHVNALRIEDGGVVWRTEDRFRGEPVDMRMVSGGLLVRSRALDLLDSETGRSLWRKRTDRFDEESQVQVDEAAVYLAEEKRLSMVDLATGDVARLAEYDFHGDKPSRIEASDESLLLMSRQNLLQVTRAGEIEYHVYQEAPSAGFFEKLAAGLALAAYSINEQTDLENPGAVSQEVLNETRAAMLESYPALSARYGSSEETYSSYYMFTDTPVADREGYSLVRLDKSSGLETGRLWVDDRSAKYTIDELTDTIYLLETAYILRALRLETNLDR